MKKFRNVIGIAAFALAIAGAVVTNANASKWQPNAWKLLPSGCTGIALPADCDTVSQFTCTMNTNIVYQDNQCTIQFKRPTP